MSTHYKPKSIHEIQRQSKIVPDVGDMPPEFSPSPHDVTDDGVRHSARLFAEQHGPGEFGATIPRLHRVYERVNDELYDNVLPKDPLILIGPGRGFGWYTYRSQLGGQHEIGITRKCFSRKNKYLLRNEETEDGFVKFIDDVLLHESAHLCCNFIRGVPEISYHGHGPEFASLCNEIGGKLGLGPVKSCRSRSKKLAHIPSCAQWPSCVRPEGYYEGAEISPEPDEDSDETLSIDEKADRAFEYLRTVCERCGPTESHLQIMGQAAVIACRLRYGRHLLKHHSQEIPFSEAVVI